MSSQDDFETTTYLLDDLEQLRSHLAKQYQVWQIVKDDAGQAQWSQQGGDGEQLYGPDNLPLSSPKSLLFADKEPLYRFDGHSFEKIKPDLAPQVLFGVQACDLTAIAYQDQFFADDPYYQARRTQTLLVGIDCNAPCEQGFCHKVDAGPQVHSQHADLVLNKLEGSSLWLLIVSTPKGLESIDKLRLEQASEDHWLQRSQQKKQILTQFKDYSYIDNGIEQINDNSVPLDVWQTLSVQCLGCSGCTNLCPTCSCYSTYEVASVDNLSQGTTYTTLRSWDSCLFEGFQKEASGHNPSHDAAKRVERFWFHKFSDDFLPEFGRYGCVGCGRCETTCPGAIGVHSVFKRIEQTCCN